MAAAEHGDKGLADRLPDLAEADYGAGAGIGWSDC